MIVQATIRYAHKGEVRQELFAGTTERDARRSAWLFAFKNDIHGFVIEAKQLLTPQERLS
jgi:hypothetical protein